MISLYKLDEKSYRFTGLHHIEIHEGKAIEPYSTTSWDSNVGLKSDSNLLIPVQKIVVDGGEREIAVHPDLQKVIDMFEEVKFSDVTVEMGVREGFNQRIRDLEECRDKAQRDYSKLYHKVLDFRSLPWYRRVLGVLSRKKIREELL